MEADWEIEIGGDSPVIDGHWSGFVDLRREPGRATFLSETCQLPALAEVLIKLNAPTSTVWTSKSDVFVPDHVDCDELDASPTGALRALACYIDLLPSEKALWMSADDVISACRQVCDRLHQIPLRSCRADLVIRRAVVDDGVESLGVTGYISAAGQDNPAAATTLAAALAAFADAIGASPVPEKAFFPGSNGRIPTDCS